MAHNRTCRKVSLPSQKTDMQIPDWDHVALVLQYNYQKVSWNKNNRLSKQIFSFEWYEEVLDLTHWMSDSVMKQGQQIVQTQRMSDGVMKQIQHRHCQTVLWNTADCPNTHTLSDSNTKHRQPTVQTHTLSDSQPCETKTADCPNNSTVRKPDRGGTDLDHQGNDLGLVREVTRADRLETGQQRVGTPTSPLLHLTTTTSSDSNSRR